MPHALAFAIALTTLALLQSQPDFSGRWILDNPPTAAPDVALILVVDQPLTQTSVRGEPMPPDYRRISIRRERPSGTTAETREIGVIGGTSSGVGVTGQPMATPSKRFETVWHDSSLVLVDRADGSSGPHTGAWSERHEAWTLQPDGRLRIEIVSDGYDQPQQRMLLLYRRE